MTHTFEVWVLILLLFSLILVVVLNSVSHPIREGLKRPKIKPPKIKTSNPFKQIEDAGKKLGGAIVDAGKEAGGAIVDTAALAEEEARRLAAEAEEFARQQTMILKVFERLAGSIEKLFESVTSTNQYLNSF